LSGLVEVTVRAHDLANAAGADDLADGDGRQVPRSVIHPRPDRRVDRDVPGVDERLAGAELRNLGSLEADGLLVDGRRRTLGEDKAAIDVAHVRSLSVTQSDDSSEREQNSDKQQGGALHVLSPSPAPQAPGAM
jgi:hypothetical protein